MFPCLSGLQMASLRWFAQTDNNGQLWSIDLRCFAAGKNTVFSIPHLCFSTWYEKEVLFAFFRHPVTQLQPKKEIEVFARHPLSTADLGGHRMPQGWTQWKNNSEINMTKSLNMKEIRQNKMYQAIKKCTT